MWLVDNIQRIISFVNSVVDSVAAIAAGQISGAASYIESSIARTIPMILSGLAQFLKLNGIAKKIQQAIEKVRKPIDNAIDKGIGFVVKKVKGWFGKSKGGKDKVKKDEVDKDDKDSTIKPEKFSMKGKGHTLTLLQGEVHMASKRSALRGKIRSTIKFVNEKIESGEKLDGNHDAKIVKAGLENLLNSAMDLEKKYGAAPASKKKSFGLKFVALADKVESFGDKYGLQELSYQAAESKFERLPKNGKWQGKPGNSGWLSSDPGVKNITKGKPVFFSNGVPNFSPWSAMDIPIPNMDGTDNDMDKLYVKLVEEGTYSSKSKARSAIASKYRIHHHPNGRVLQLIPTILHEKVSHVGGASKLRRGN